MVEKPGKNPAEVSSYRPISLLPLMSKLIEKLFLKRMLPILEEQNIIPDHQFGFRTHHGTTEQIHRVAHLIRQTMERKEYCSAVFLDVQQAFDRVWHKGLLYKLKQCLPNTAYMLLKSYLQQRIFQVKIGDQLSSFKEIEAGVPQGSVLGPILYTVYTADLPTSADVMTATYADDTAILSCDKDPDLATKKLQEHLNKINLRLKTWRIRASAPKSIHITFTLRKGDCPPVKLNGTFLPQKTTVKYLGMHLDRKLTWREHIKAKKEQISRKLKELFWIIGRQSKLSLENELLIYKCVIKLIWTYGIELWGSASHSNIEILQRSQNNVLKIVCNAPWFIKNILQTGDGRPTQVCYLCYTQLRKCHDLMIKTVKSNALLASIMDTGAEVTESSIKSFGREHYILPDSLNMSCIEFTNVLEHGIPHTVAIKEEVITTQEDIDCLVKTHVGEKPYSCTLCKYKCSMNGYLKAHMRTHTGEKPYYCSLCEYNCSLKGQLTRHMRTHTGEKPYSCTLCTYKCSQKGYLKIHMMTHTGEKPYSCQLCEYNCSDKRRLNRHMKTHTGEKPYSCTLCTYKCSLNGNLTAHMRTHTGEKPYSCSLCEYNCSYKGQLTRHMRTHTGEKPYSCTLCEYKCSQKGYLKTHMMTHTGEKPYSCTLCEYNCSDKRRLTRHTKTHTGGKPYSCTLCKYKCLQSRYLKAHMRTHTGERPYSCSLCEYSCSHKAQLTTHMRIHTEDKPYSCTLCKYKCSQKEYLIAHMKTHTGDKPYSCSLCEYNCSHKGHLTTHMRIHTGEKPYSCILCKYKCSQKRYLKAHMRTHTGEKPYSCSICEHSCSNKGHLTIHMRIHTGEKPYSCTLCEYNCSYKGNLRTHMKTHTEEKPYSCTLCEYKCSLKSNLMRHLNKHRKET